MCGAIIVQGPEVATPSSQLCVSTVITPALTPATHLFRDSIRRPELRSSLCLLRGPRDVRMNPTTMRKPGWKCKHANANESTEEFQREWYNLLFQQHLATRQELRLRLAPQRARLQRNRRGRPQLQEQTKRDFREELGQNFRPC